MPAARVALQRQGPVAWLTLDGSQGRRLTPDGLHHLVDTLAALADDAGVRVAVLRAAVGTFCPAWDRDALLHACADLTGLRRLATTFQQIAETPLPVIAALEGDVLGAGLELALVCDVRIASTNARLGFPESVDGVLPAGGSVARLARLAGRAAALRLLLTGDPLSAADALACGLVSAVYPPDQLAGEAERLATVIASRGPLAIRYAKEAIACGTEMPLDQALRYETDLTVILQTTADRAEGVRAFAEKRTPSFRGE